MHVRRGSELVADENKDCKWTGELGDSLYSFNHIFNSSFVSFVDILFSMKNLRIEKM